MPKPSANFVVMCLTMIICTVLGVYGFLGVHGKDAQGFLTIFGTTIGPLVGILWNNFVTKKVQDQQAIQSGQITTIEKNTNGALTQKLNDLPAKVAETVVPAIQEGQNK